MFSQFFPSASITFCITVIIIHCVIVSGHDYDNDAYPDEDKRISASASVNEAEGNHRNEKRNGDSQPLGMKTSTVIEISPDNSNSANSNENDQDEATISYTPNTKMQLPITFKKTPLVVSNSRGKEKTVLSQKLPQKPSRVVVDVKEKKDKSDPFGKKKWETDLVVEGKAKKVSGNVLSDSIVSEVVDSDSPTDEVIDAESTKTKTEEIIDVEPVPAVSEEVIDVEPVPDTSDEVIEVVKSPLPNEVTEVVEPSVSDEVIQVVKPPVPSAEVVVLESHKPKTGQVLVKAIKTDPVDIDIENIGKHSKVVTALKENKHEILDELSGGLTPDLIRWAEEAIAAGIDNIVNAVEDKYIGYIKSRTRRKRAAPPDDDDDDDVATKTSSKTLHRALKKVQKAAAVLATNEAQNAAKAASTAAKLNMDVTSQVASDAMKSVASAIGTASQNAAKQIVDAENAAAAAALAGAAPVIVAGAASRAPVIVTDASSAPAAAIEQIAAGDGAGRDLIQQTLQIQKGLNLVMRAVLKEKERVAADLARYQNKISFLLREMAGAPVELAVAEAGASRRRRREVRRQRRAVVSTEHLRQLLQREESRVNQMLQVLDMTINSEKRKRATDVSATCQGRLKKRSKRSLMECSEIG